MCKPDVIKGLEVHVDADFAGGFDESNAEEPASACSSAEHIINFSRCPIIRKSKLQIEIAFSTTKAENVDLQTSLRKTIPITHFLRESRALEIAKTPKMRPRTKYASIKCHYFRTHADKEDLMLKKIDAAISGFPR